MSTPSLTMLTATSQRSVERVKACSFSAARASVCRTTVGVWPVVSRSTLRHRPRVLAVGGHDEPARVAMAAGADLLEALVRRREDARQAVGQLERRSPCGSAGPPRAR